MDFNKVSKSADENLFFVGEPSEVDRINAEFYGKFPYPWPPTVITIPVDKDISRLLVNQNIGDYTHSRIPTYPKVWIAGCGTNQAIYLCLRFPEAQVLASDLSSASLEACERTARSLGIKNLTLRRESLNEVQYDEEFDYVISTGVAHHNSKPGDVLSNLRKSLKPKGVLELMVYNRYHRLINAAVQRAVRLLAGTATDLPQYEKEYNIAKRLVDSFSPKNVLGRLLARHRASTEAELADALIQPLEYSYTVDSLSGLTEVAGLEFLVPTLCEFDQATDSFDWEVELCDQNLNTLYSALPDIDRWKLANWLLLERSPMLWFYMQRSDCPESRVPEAEINRRFLSQKFRKIESTQRQYRRTADGNYILATEKIPFPSGNPPDLVAALYSKHNAKLNIEAAVRGCGMPLSPAVVRKMRVRLTTTAFPYLIAGAD